MSKRKRLSESVVKRETGNGRDYQVFDDLVIGFALVIYRSGNRSFAINYRMNGRLRRYTIGRWPEWTVQAARARAAELRQKIEAGIDPMDVRQSSYDAAGIEELIELYKADHLSKVSARFATDHRSMIETYVLPQWKGRLVNSITSRDIDQLLTLVASGTLSVKRTKDKPAIPTPIRANRCGEMLRSMFALALKAGMRPDNPALKFRRRDEVARERFLTLDEFSALAKALDKVKDRLSAEAVRMLMLTGARRGEVLSAQFADFDLAHLIWTKQAATTKQRKIHRVPISEEVAMVVRARRTTVPKGCPWLFPLQDGSGPVSTIHRGWVAIKDEACLEDLRLHDVRHTFASLLVSEGLSLEIIGGLLGHSSTRTTSRYAHLMDSPLRAGVNSVAALLKPRLRVIDGGN